MTVIEWIYIIIGAFAFFNAGVVAGAIVIMHQAIEKGYARIFKGKFKWYEKE